MANRADIRVEIDPTCKKPQVIGCSGDFVVPLDQKDIIRIYKGERLWA